MLVGFTNIELVSATAIMATSTASTHYTFPPSFPLALPPTSYIPTCANNQLDLDTIDLSNLNRQFLFRKPDIGKSKSLVAAATAHHFNPSSGIKINARHGNVKDSENDIAWISKFGFVMNALDNAGAYGGGCSVGEDQKLMRQMRVVTSINSAQPPTSPSSSLVRLDTLDRSLPSFRSVRDRSEL